MFSTEEMVTLLTKENPNLEEQLKTFKRVVERDLARKICEELNRFENVTGFGVSKLDVHIVGSSDESCDPGDKDLEVRIRVDFTGF